MDGGRCRDSRGGCDTFPAVGNSNSTLGGVDRRIWMDGELVPWAEASVHVLSHSLQRGSLIFDYMSVHATPRGPAVFRMREHLERLLRSAELVGLPLGRSVDELGAAILETVRANPGATAVKVSAYLPSIEVDVVPHRSRRLSVAIAAYDPWEDVIVPHIRASGPLQRPSVKHLGGEGDRRNRRRRHSCTPQAKVAANYTSPMLAKWRARRRGYDEILLVDEDGMRRRGTHHERLSGGRRGRLCARPRRRTCCSA